MSSIPKLQKSKTSQGGGKFLLLTGAVVASVMTAFGAEFVVDSALQNSNNPYLDDAIWLPADGSSSTRVGATSSGDPGDPNIYRQNSKRLNVPSSGLYTFPGDRLVLDGNNLIFRSTTDGGALQGLVVDDLRVAGNVTVLNWSTLVNPILDGNIVVESGKTLTFGAGNGTDANGEAKIRQFLVTATISGPGAMALNSSKPSDANYPPMPSFIYGDNSGLTGGVTFNDGYGRFCVTNENALGSGSVTFKGSTLLVQQDVSFPSRERSMTLSTTNSKSPTIEVAEGATFNLAWSIKGANANVPLIKGGAGTLVLDAASDYSGMTKVREGTLRITREEYVSPNTTFEVSEGAKLLIGDSYTSLGISEGEYLDVDNAGLKAATLSISGTGGFAVDLDGVSGGNATALIRVTEAMTHAPFAVTVFAVTNAPEADTTPIRLLSAPSLADFKNVDFFVDPPYAGTLSRTSGEGEEVLWFTPVPRSKIIFKTASDRDEQTKTNYYVEENDFWDNGGVATEGNMYVSTNVWVQSRGAFPAPFVAYGPAYLMPRSSTASFPDLTLMDGVQIQGWDVGATLAGHVHLAPITHNDSKYAARIYHMAEASKHLFIACEFDGYGTFDWMVQGNNDTETYVTICGKNTNFFGKVNIHPPKNEERPLRFCITSEESLGGNPPAFRADQLRIYNYGFLCVSNNVTLDDPNRGITVGREEGTSATTVGQMFVTNGAVLTVACPIAGNSLNIVGQGTVILANSTNTYYGGSTIWTGATGIPRGAKSFGTGLLQVRDGGTLAIPWPHDMANGLEINGGGNRRLEFLEGSRLTVAFADGYVMTRQTTIPLLQTPDGASGNATQQSNAAEWYSSAENFPFDCKVPGFSSELKLEGRLLSVTFSPVGFMMIVR